jgi:rhamnosyltransferase
MNKNLDILFVIVLYKIKLEQSATYLSIVNSLNETEFNMDLLVYDNSPDADKCLFGDVSKLNITYIADKANSGVSKAYNTGADLAAKMNKKWLLLLDQDTNFPVQTITEYLSAIDKYSGEKLFTPIMFADQKNIISPCYFKFMRGFAARHVEAGVNSLNKYSIINCGMCIDLKSFYKNGGYNELLKLDFSDHEFIRRFKKNVTNRFVVIDLKVKHHLSTETKNSFNNDKVRFNYYLNASTLISNNWAERVLIKFNVLIRTFKLSAIHKTSYFISRLFDQAK